MKRLREILEGIAVIVGLPVLIILLIALLSLGGCCNCPPDVRAAYIKGHNDGFQDGIDHVGNGTREGL